MLLARITRRSTIAAFVLTVGALVTDARHASAQAARWDARQATSMPTRMAMNTSRGR